MEKGWLTGKGKRTGKDLCNHIHPFNQVIDFEATDSGTSLAIKVGVEAELDKKRSLHSSLPGFLSAVAEEECARLPGIGGTVCTVTYIPQVRDITRIYVDAHCVQSLGAKLNKNKCRVSIICTEGWDYRLID